MKTLLSKLLIATALCTCSMLASANPQHSAATNAAPTADENSNTVSIRQNDFALCGTAFYDNLYALTVTVFSIGADKVIVTDYERQVFGLIRSSDEFKGFEEEFVEHAKDIPRQLVEIIKEDSHVLDSCNNFSVALVGPP